jgi:hypothetical protein
LISTSDLPVIRSESAKRGLQLHTDVESPVRTTEREIY